MEKKEPQIIAFDITWRALLKLLAMAIAIWAAFTLRDIIFMVFVVFIFVAAVNPSVKALQRHMSRGIAVTFFFVLIITFFIVLSYLFVPTLLEQMNQLTKIMPELLAKAKPLVASLNTPKYSKILNDSIAQLSGGVSTFSGNFYSTLLQVFGGIATLVSGLILSFYLLLEEKNAREFFHQVLPADRYRAAYNTVRKISIQLGAWIRGQLTIMLTVAVLNIIAYLIIGIPSSLALGIWSGLGEAIPYIGPVIGVFPGFVLALTTESILKIILVIVVNYFVIQQIQNFYITPNVMSRVVGLSPVLVILSILIGISLFGFVGAIIALPVAAIISVVVADWPNLRTLWEQVGQSDED